MKKIILSIKPEYVSEIFSGNKKFEYRKTDFTDKGIETVIIYCTKPVGKLVGEFTVEDILKGLPDAIWEQTNIFSGISKSFFDKYFCDRPKAYALKISNLKKYNKPIDPYLNKNFTPPQSFRYVNDEELAALLAV